MKTTISTTKLSLVFAAMIILSACGAENSDSDKSESAIRLKKQSPEQRPSDKKFLKSKCFVTPSMIYKKKGHNQKPFESPKREEIHHFEDSWEIPSWNTISEVTPLTSTVKRTKVISIPDLKINDSESWIQKITDLNSSLS